MCEAQQCLELLQCVSQSKHKKLSEWPESQITLPVLLQHLHHQIVSQPYNTSQYTCLLSMLISLQIRRAFTRM